MFVPFLLSLVLFDCATIIYSRIAPPIIEDITTNPLKECAIRINGDLPDPQPLLLDPDTNAFLEPTTKDGLLSFRNGHEIKLFCTRSFAKPFVNTTTILATCVHENEFNVNGKLYHIKSLNCTNQVYHTARKTNTTCYNNTADIIELGFKVDRNKFIHLMDVCFDDILQRTWYSHYRLTPGSAGFQKSFPRTGFIQGPFFGKTRVNDLFKTKNQRKTMAKTLGATRMQAILNGTDMLLAPGHLSAKVDHIYGAQQRATFYFVNVAPQWQRFDLGNWESIEHGVRTLLASRDITADIYTGTYGTLSMENDAGEWRQIYLDYDANGNGLIPVPKLFYKLVVDQENENGVVLIGVNDIHTSRDRIMHDGYIICPDVGDQIKWIPWDRTNILKGYSYACDVNEFLQVVDNLPSTIKASSLLI